MSADTPVNILLVDDQPGKLLSYETILRGLNENLLTASSAQTAFEHLLKQEIAVVLIDVCMPELDGFELAAMLRGHPRFQTMSIIFVSAIALTDLDFLKGYEYGAVDYVPVPVVPEVLRAKVRVFTELYRKTQQLKDMNQELERRVEERTRELAHANAELERRVEERTREREVALAQVHEMQKLESLGQLTGGVAHDFNNVLMAVLGNLEIVERRIADERLRRVVQSASRAAWRGAKLTEQLLAYARKQRLTPEAINLNKLFGGGSIDMMRRTLGGAVEVNTAFVADPWPALVDPTQIELVVLNLAINARDAMPMGGAITIETANVPNGDARLPSTLKAGDYVMIAVTDNGTGMTDEVAAKAFEPFFSTKGPGKGNGLGLSQVYGMAQQSGGGVTLKTRVGQGTRVEVFLPRTEMPEAEPPAPRGEPAPAPAATRVLVVDDQEDVLETAVANLEALEYTTVAASNPKTALELMEAQGPFDLMITDFAMAGMSGLELARAARRMQANLPVIIVTGYADVDHIGRADRVQVLKKPYMMDDLSHTIERALATRNVVDFTNTSDRAASQARLASRAAAADPR